MDILSIKFAAPVLAAALVGFVPVAPNDDGQKVADQTDQNVNLTRENELLRDRLTLLQQRLQRNEDALAVLSTDAVDAKSRKKNKFFPGQNQLNTQTVKRFPDRSTLYSQANKLFPGQSKLNPQANQIYGQTDGHLPDDSLAQSNKLFPNPNNRQSDEFFPNQNLAQSNKLIQDQNNRQSNRLFYDQSLAQSDKLREADDCLRAGETQRALDILNRLAAANRNNQATQQLQDLLAQTRDAQKVGDLTAAEKLKDLYLELLKSQWLDRQKAAQKDAPAATLDADAAILDAIHDLRAEVRKLRHQVADLQKKLDRSLSY